MLKRFAILPAASLLALVACQYSASLPTTSSIQAAFATATPPADPDDPAIWVHPTDPSKSLIIGTVKGAAPNGAVAVFAIDGAIRQLIDGIDRTNNVDVEYGFQRGGQTFDIVVATERLKRLLHRRPGRVVRGARSALPRRRDGRDEQQLAQLSRVQLAGHRPSSCAIDH